MAQKLSKKLYICMQISKTMQVNLHERKNCTERNFDFSTIQRNDMFANFETMQMNLYERNNCTERHLNHSFIISRMSSSLSMYPCAHIVYLLQVNNRLFEIDQVRYPVCVMHSYFFTLDPVVFDWASWVKGAMELCHTGERIQKKIHCEAIKAPHVG